MPRTSAAYTSAWSLERRTRRRRGQRRRCRRAGLADDDAGHQFADPVGAVRPDLQVDDHQVLFELRPRRHQRPVRRHDQGVTVEDELVLSADLVHVGDGTARLRHTSAQHGEALGVPAPVVRRRVEVDHDVGAGAAFVGNRTVVEPDVLTDRDTHPRARHAEEGRRTLSRHEPALLVEHAVVGEEPLAVETGHTPTRAHRGRVGQSPRHRATPRRSRRRSRTAGLRRPLSRARRRCRPRSLASRGGPPADTREERARARHRDRLRPPRPPPGPGAPARRCPSDRPRRC